MESAFFVIYMDIVKIWTVFSMGLIEHLMKACYPGPKPDSCLKYFREMSLYLILKIVSFQLNKKNITQQELLYGMNSKWQIVLP